MEMIYVAGILLGLMLVKNVVFEPLDIYMTWTALSIYIYRGVYYIHVFRIGVHLSITAL